ncbi:uncharacterized protein BT62DRAFT_973974 [Guyanagaster necrorhizus]|uniref:SMODS and SLOG-associating 2TM effector domain-containing protein n=1 Tax=Guyanagaster necrorhizus TaxID=856835 RepID=A0A9P7VJC4_9AGAR|nr:uncharacterized protein BT62DRAFT_973974 [Guyanagaster necrorhizus MCA 3950]KAG7442201.1 hypothetical protein BT62DRAFT_973974 [Guyanagaster necrorhizus MCA 3950]
MDLSQAPDRVGRSSQHTQGGSSLALSPGPDPTIAVPVPIIGPERNSTYTSIRHSSPLSDQGDAPRSDTSYAPLHTGGGQRNQPLPPVPDVLRQDSFSPGRRGTRASRGDIDWIIPIDRSEKASRLKTVGERLQPTLTTAETSRDKYVLKARMTGYALNIAIGLQVLLGALTTGLSAATSGKQTSIAISILGGIATLVASYLARARGSNEPELSITRVKDLEQFIRECQAFQMDHGHDTGHQFDSQLENFRRRFEELLGNANGERKLSPV